MRVHVLVAAGGFAFVLSAVGSATAGVAGPAPCAPPNPIPWACTYEPKSCAVARAPDPCQAPRRGPIEIRDNYLLAQPFLTLPAVSADTLGCGHSSVRVQAVWSNTFGWRQTATGENPGQRFFLVDGETRTVELDVAHGVGANFDIGARIPLHWRGAGVSDSSIDSFHELGGVIGLTDNKRHDFINDRFRINGRLEDGGSFNADREKGIGLGNLEVSGKWRFADGGRDGSSFAAIGRVTGPTGSKPFDPDGFEGALQIVGATRVADDWDLYFGLGAIGRTEKRFQGMPFAGLVGHGFLAVEWRFAPRWSLLVESDYSTTLADGIQQYDKDRWYLDVGVKVDLDAHTIFEMGFVENFVSQQTTLDFGIHFGIEHRF